MSKNKYYIKQDDDDKDLWYVMDDIGTVEESNSKQEAEAIMKEYELEI